MTTKILQVLVGMDVILLQNNVYVELKLWRVAHVSKIQIAGNLGPYVAHILQSIHSLSELNPVWKVLVHHTAKKNLQTQGLECALHIEEKDMISLPNAQIKTYDWRYDQYTSQTFAWEPLKTYAGPTSL